MAIAPASVGVNIPKRMPPIIIKGRRRGRKAGLNAVQSSPAVALFSVIAL